jgi:AraC family transcriptional regulator of adaptative response / DNA-3-methyladenine glycosylase II
MARRARRSALLFNGLEATEGLAAEAATDAGSVAADAEGDAGSVAADAEGDAGSVAADADADTLYRALESRDRRFEGRFVVAVTSTGIYCRPGCPARLPARRNVRFYSHPAAAEAAGFRACFRCRPELSAWAGTSATVKRALALIDGGALTAEDDVARLAERLGIGERHLRRLFAEHVGASPLAVAQTRRAHFARQLVETSDLPLAQVAFAAGFGSVRAFNAAMRRAFGRAPSQLRRPVAVRESGGSTRAGSPRGSDRAGSDRRGGSPRGGSPRGDGPRAGSPRAEDDGALTLALPFRAPLPWDALVAFLAGRAIPGVEVVDGAVYRRTTSDGGLVEAHADARRLHVRLRVPSAGGVRDAVERLRRLFDLVADPSAIAAVLGRDRALAPAVSARPGLRVPGGWDGLELAMRAILGQQVTVAHASAMAGSLVRAYGRPLAAPAAGLTHVFPDAATLAGAGGEAIARAVGMPRARGHAIAAVARAVADGSVALDRSLPPELLHERLLALPGIGPWTAQYLLMRLGEPDAFPAGDLWLRRALDLDERALIARAERWRPFRAYAALYLWTSEVFK